VAQSPFPAGLTAIYAKEALGGSQKDQQDSGHHFYQPLFFNAIQSAQLQLPFHASGQVASLIALPPQVQPAQLDEGQGDLSESRIGHLHVLDHPSKTE
jgi:hypothetical protein